jgi:predicted transcriptional regulator
MSDEPRRITIALIPKAQEALDRTAERTGLSKTDIMNRAIQAYAFLDEQVVAGAKILVQRGKSVEEVRFL